MDLDSCEQDELEDEAPSYSIVSDFNLLSKMVLAVVEDRVAKTGARTDLISFDPSDVIKLVNKIKLPKSPRRSRLSLNKGENR